MSFSLAWCCPLAQMDNLLLPFTKWLLLACVSPTHILDMEHYLAFGNEGYYKSTEADSQKAKALEVGRSEILLISASVPGA